MRLWDRIWWMMRANLNDKLQSTCQNHHSGPIYSTPPSHTLNKASNLMHKINLRTIHVFIHANRKIMSSECLDVMSQLRESKGLDTIKFLPHCGEVCIADPFTTFLVLLIADLPLRVVYCSRQWQRLPCCCISYKSMTHNIAHGINLRKSPVLSCTGNIKKSRLCSGTHSFGTCCKFVIE